MMASSHNNFGLLRLALATLVVFGHFRILPSGVHATGIYDYADFAVDAFFVISGYLIYASFDKNPAIRSFYIRRLFRIYPLYAVTVVIQTLILALLAGGALGDMLQYLLPNLFMANFLAHGMDNLLAGLHNQGINPSLWTLKIEVGFYLILPLLWYCVRRWKIGFLLLYVASTAFALVMLHYGMDTVARQLPGQLRFFVVGMAAFHYRDRLQIKTPRALLFALVLFALCSLRHYMWFMPFYPLCVGLLMFICAMRLPAWPVRFDISYGVYLFHAPLIQLSLLLGIFQDNALFLCGLLVLVYLMAFVAERMVEDPGIEYGKRLAGRFA